MELQLDRTSTESLVGEAVANRWNDGARAAIVHDYNARDLQI